MKINISKELDTIFDNITVVHIPGKATVMSGYPLTSGELGKIKESIPELTKLEMVNIVDKTILSGIIIKFGTQMYDLTVNGALQNLRKQIYESN